MMNVNRLVNFSDNEYHKVNEHHFIDENGEVTTIEYRPSFFPNHCGYVVARKSKKDVMSGEVAQALEDSLSKTEETVKTIMKALDEHYVNNGASFNTKLVDKTLNELHTLLSEEKWKCKQRGEETQALHTAIGYVDVLIDALDTDYRFQERNKRKYGER